jgi:cyclopropane fatty-acyl-phospholipid synthase-like methyltransferase
MGFAYDPSVFDVSDMNQAMRIILTAESSTTRERWEKETPYIADLVGRKMSIAADTLLLDYGCGIGRIAKALIARYGCRVLGVDISPSMRSFAAVYVESDRFVACSAAMLDLMLERGLSFDNAISIWVLQHCERPAGEIDRIRRALKADGKLLVVNSFARVVPGVEKKLFTAVPTLERNWFDDGVDVSGLLRSTFSQLDDGPVPVSLPGIIADRHFWALFGRASEQRP